MSTEQSSQESTIAPFGDRDDRHAVEECLLLAPKFDERGLIVAVAQDATTKEVLMVAYMNEESLRLTLQLGEAVYFSRSRQELWHKGKTSGHVQKIKDLRVDCDQDCLLLEVEQVGPGCCHVGYRSCFYRSAPLAEEAEEAEAYPLNQAIPEKAYDPSKVYF
ncbi:MAG: phosphoribosyl-AMP cyclohydrolase [Verrucomicrobiota bacterium]